MKKPLLLSSPRWPRALRGHSRLRRKTDRPRPPATAPPPNSAPVTSVGGGAIGIGAVAMALRRDGC